MEDHANSIDTFLKKDLLRWGMYHHAFRERLIDKHLLLSPEPTPEVRKRLIDNWCREKQISTDDALDLWLQHNQHDRETWQTFLIRKWQWSEWCLHKFDDKLSSYYLKRKQAMAKVTYSLLRVSQKDLCFELYLRIKEGEASFQEIALNFSEGPEQKCGGLIGPVELSHPHPILAKKLESSRQDELSLPIKLERWWVVIRLEKLEPAILNQKTSLRLALELGDKYLRQLLNEPFKDTDANI